jgi:hypothetical protein
VLLVIGLGVFASATASVALAGGGKSLASAPVMPIGKQVTGGGKTVGSRATGACSGYGEYWRLPAVKGDHVEIAFGSRNGQPVKVAVWDPTVTAKAMGFTPEVTENDTFYKDVVDFVATKTGKYTVVVLTSFICQPSLAYTLTATLKNKTPAT